MNEQEIVARRMLERDTFSTAPHSLKERVLRELAETEKLEVDDGRSTRRSADHRPDRRIARKVRAQFEREEMLDTLAAQLIERKALDLILDSAVYEDVPLDAESEPGQRGRTGGRGQASNRAVRPLYRTGKGGSGEVMVETQ